MNTGWRCKKARRVGWSLQTGQGRESKKSQRLWSCCSQGGLTWLLVLFLSSHFSAHAFVDGNTVWINWKCWENYMTRSFSFVIAKICFFKKVFLLFISYAIFGFFIPISLHLFVYRASTTNSLQMLLICCKLSSVLSSFTNCYRASCVPETDYSFLLFLKLHCNDFISKWYVAFEFQHHCTY